MGNDDELEVGLGLSVLDNCMERFGQCLDVVGIQVRGGFIKSNDLEVIVSHV